MESLDELRRSVGPASPGAAPVPGRKEQFWEGRAGVVIGISLLVAIGVFLAAIFLIPGFLEWLIKIGVWLVFVILILFIVVGLVIAFLVTGVSIFYLAKKTEYQGPEASYDLDMVKEPPKGNV
jgi:flagellar basal body-associated protein FliL